VSFTRRSLLQVAVIAATALMADRMLAKSAAALSAPAFAVPPNALLVYDSRLRPSRALNARHPVRSIDLAHEHANFWRELRGLRFRGPVVGLTSWTDLVQVRTLLAERGWRLRAETRCGTLFYWEMA